MDINNINMGQIDSDLIHAMYLSKNENRNIVNSLRFANDEYNKFKRKFLTTLELFFVSKEKLILKAIKQKTNFVLTPEVSSKISLGKKKLLKTATSMEKDIYLNGIKDLAKKYKIWILIGSLILKISKNKLVNRSILISSKGKIQCYYDKIHMYDAKLSTKEQYFESKLFKSCCIYIRW